MSSKDFDVYDPVPLGNVHDVMVKNDAEYRAAYKFNTSKYALIEAMFYARHDSGLSLNEIARRMGISRATLSLMLTCAKVPNLQGLVSFAEAVGKVPVVSFLDDD